jgi:hypothetical protein
MASPLGVLSVYLATATTEVEEDVTSMAGPLGVLHLHAGPVMLEVSW